MTLPSFIILVVAAVAGVLIFLELGAIPGNKAREKGHPQADAINILGWFGLLLAGPGWIIALVWAYTNPQAAPYSQKGSKTRSAPVESRP